MSLEFGLSKQEELELRARAVLGAIKDMRGSARMDASRDMAEAARIRTDDAAAVLMDQHGISKSEADIILAEELIVKINQGDME